MKEVSKLVLIAAFFLTGVGLVVAQTEQGEKGLNAMVMSNEVMGNAMMGNEMMGNAMMMGNQLMNQVGNEMMNMMGDEDDMPMPTK